ncbi:hypothetical protein MLD38_011299 [Melastoma candidum]|uniref:Uncharacterized protein n=1 Tax=Melastoma candidum TaxID=119954 RepID=A0ACB9R2L9_9MYRT|nr:hypothetical protein MLD38_011299 [Melastoma candidum]
MLLLMPLSSMSFQVARHSWTVKSFFHAQEGITEIDEGPFSEVVLRSNVPVLVEFVATWCGPCRLISPAMEWLAQEYKDRLKVVKIYHYANPKLIEEYKVYWLPTLILFKDGVEVPTADGKASLPRPSSRSTLALSLPPSPFLNLTTPATPISFRSIPEQHGPINSFTVQNSNPRSRLHVNEFSDNMSNYSVLIEQ